MQIEKWEKDKNEYILSNGFMLKKADKGQFGIHEAIYSNVDTELSFSWKIRIKQSSDNLFWIYKDGKKVGGVNIRPNLMGSFFMESPCTHDRFTVISALNEVFIQWSEKDKLRIFGVLPGDIEYYNKLGYRIKYQRRVMIKPTEVYDDIEWGDDFIVRTPTLEDASELGKLFNECYTGGPDYEAFGEENVEKATESAKYVINVYKDNGPLDGCIVVFDKKSKQLIAACLAGINGFCDNDFSEIGEIVVKPEYQHKGIATKMIKYALTNLNKISPATILCVTIGNTAESLYYNTGFFPGVMFTSMVLR